jgi:hypothetical protein
MSLLDNIGRNLSTKLDRVKFEADKFQRVARIQGALSDLRKQIDARRLELGDRAIELYRAGQIQSATLGEILQAIEALQRSLTLKEEELKQVQAETYVEPARPADAPQPVPVSAEPPPAATPAAAPPPAPASTAGPTPAPVTKACPNCGFQMPGTSRFCPACGARVGG